MAIIPKIHNDPEPGKMISTLDEVRRVVAAIEDKKGEQIRVLDVHGKSSITDYMIIATGTSDPHLNAIKTELGKVFEEIGVKSLGESREVGSGWIVIDAFDYMVHLQTNEKRDFYRLEQLWKDATVVEL